MSGHLRAKWNTIILHYNVPATWLYYSNTILITWIAPVMNNKMSEIHFYCSTPVPHLSLQVFYSFLFHRSHRLIPDGAPRLEHVSERHK